MELLHAIATRRAVREYCDAPVSRDMVRALLDAAVQAPSARNLQPWSFAVLLDRQRIEECAQQAQRWLLAHQAAELGPMLKTLADPAYSIFYHAPALLLILASEPTLQAAEDCCLAAQNFMLAARDRDLGTCWIGLARPWLNQPASKAALGLPAACAVIAPIIMGHPKAWPIGHGRKPAQIYWIDD